MKLKKLLAAVTAAALAVSTMAVTSFTASAAAKDPVEITLYDSSTAVSGLDCGNDGKTYSVSGANMSDWNVTEDNISNCSFKITYAAAPTAGVVGINTNAESGGVDWTANFAYYDNLDGTTTEFSLSGIGEKAAAGAANGVTLQIKSSIITSVDFNDGNADHNLYTYDGGAIGSVDFTPAAMSALEGASSISAAITGEGNGWGYFQETTSWSSTDGNNPAVLTSEDDKWDTFMAASGIKIILDGFTSINKVVLTITYPDAEPEGEIEISVSPKTKSIAVGEGFVVTVDVTATEGFVDVMGTTTTEYDDTVISVVPIEDENGNVYSYTVEGLAVGKTNLTFSWEPDEDSGVVLENPIAAVCEVTVTEEGGSTEVDTSKWKIAFNGFTTSWGGWAAVEGTAGVLNATCTIKDVMDKNNISSIDAFGGVIVQAWEVPLGDDVSYAIRIEAADGTLKVEDKGTYTVVVNGGNGENKDDPNYSLKQYAVAACGGNLEFAPTDVIKVVIASGTTVPSFPSTEPEPDDPPAGKGTYALLWEGKQSMPADWSGSVQIDISEDLLAKIKVGDKIVSTLTPADGAQIAYKYKNDNWDALPGFAAANGGHDYSDLKQNTYTHIVTAEDIEALKLGLIVSGHDYTLTKVELNPDNKPPVVDPDPDHTHTPADTWTSDSTGHWHACSGCSEKIDFAAHTSDNGTVTTEATATTAGIKTYKCTVCGYVIKTETIPATGSSDDVPSTRPPYVGPPIIPTTGVNNSKIPSINGESGKSGWEIISLEIGAASDGSEIVVDMNGITKVPSTIFKDISGKDVDLVLNMGSGIKWTINGLSVTGTKTIDFDVTKNTRHIPDDVVDTAEGRGKKQISLDHNGSFGCNAVLTYDVGTKYNGLYANLFYYNTKTKELELSDCSLISGGKASFVFTHASDYLITITDEPLGEFEDVSSAAGVASDDSSLGNGIVVSSVLAMIVLGFGIVVYKKRRHN